MLIYKCRYCGFTFMSNENLNGVVCCKICGNDKFEIDNTNGIPLDKKKEAIDRLYKMKECINLALIVTGEGELNESIRDKIAKLLIDYSCELHRQIREVIRNAK